MRSIFYQVPGLITPIRQPSSMSCWAAMYTMMYSWRNQRSFSIRDAVSRLGQKYTQAFDDNTGLAIEENRNLARAAGMRAEALQNWTVEGWLALLQRHGLLWTSFGWQVFDSTGLVETAAGRHIIIITGIYGDSTATGTTVRYVDPSDGQFHEMSFGRLVLGHETGFAIRRLSDTQLGQFSQVMHY